MPKTKTKAKHTKIVQKDSPILREIAAEVPVKDIKGKKIQNILDKMRQAVAEEDDGVAIAAPQIGESLRIFVIAGRAFSLNDRGEAVGDEEHPDQVFVNPKLVKLSRKKRKMEEGCLSVRWLYGQVLRSERAVVRAYDEHGKRFERGASGLLAQIFQHEVDHLDGILFIDKATNLEELPPQKK